MKGKIVAWLRLFRAHTAILETPIAVAGAGLALGTIFDVRIIGWAVFGILYHFAGYGMNSYVDWAKGFDKDDPHKEHHPLNTGEISPKAAKYGVISMLGLLIVVGEVMGNFSVVAHVSVVIMLVSGSAYNLFGKYTRLKFIPISIVHTMVFVFPYFVYADSPGVPAMLLIAGFFIHHIYQIMISGDVKDVRQDEASLLQELGTQVENVPMKGQMFNAGTTVQMIGYSLSVLQIAIATTAVFLQDGLTFSITPVALTGAWMLYESDKVIGDGPYKREMRVRAMSRKELAGIWMLCAATIPAIGYIGWAFIIAVSLAYFFPTSKLLWGNWLKPEV